MRFRKIALLLFISLLSISAFAGSAKQASVLVKKYALADDAAKPAVLQDFDTLARENPENVNVIRSYTSLLSGRGEYKKAISYLEPLNQAKADPSLLLQECMLKDRIKEVDGDCYQQVISESERKGVENMDYAMALFFTDDDKFQVVKQRLLKQNPSLSDDFNIFSQDKRRVLLSLYP